MRPGIGFYREEQCLWVYVSYLSLSFLDIGIKIHQGQHLHEHLWLLSDCDGDCVTYHRVTAYHLFLDSYFDATPTTGMARARHWYFIRNQFEQQWFDDISFHKTRRVYPAIWYSLKPFAKRKGRFKLSIPAKCTLSKDKALNKKVLKFKTSYVQEIRF